MEGLIFAILQYLASQMRGSGIMTGPIGNSEGLRGKNLFFQPVNK